MILIRLTLQNQLISTLNLFCHRIQKILEESSKAKNASALEYKQTLSDLTNLMQKLRYAVKSGALKYKMEVLQKNVESIEKKCEIMDNINEKQGKLDDVKSDMKQIEEKYRQEIEQLKCIRDKEIRKMQSTFEKIREEQVRFWEDEHLEKKIKLEELKEEYSKLAPEQKTLDHNIHEIIENSRKDYTAQKMNEMDKLRAEKAMVLEECKDLEKMSEIKRNRIKNLQKRKEELTAMIESLKKNLSDNISSERANCDLDGEERAS